MDNENFICLYQPNYRLMKRQLFTFFLCVAGIPSLVLAQDKFTSVQDAKDFINKKSANVSQPGKNYQQVLNFDTGRPGQVVMTTTWLDPKGKSGSYQTEFFLEHIDINRILQVSSTKELKLNIFSKNDQKLFKRTEGGKNSYIYHFDLFSDDRQIARDVTEAFEYLIKNLDLKKPNVSSKEQAYDWLVTNVKKNFISNGFTYDISLVLDKENNNKLTYNCVITDPKNQQKQLRYDFYMNDFNGSSYGVIVSKDVLGVNLNCTNNVKSIVYFENGVQKSYLYKYAMLVDDPKLATDVIAVLRYIKLGTFD